MSRDWRVVYAALFLALTCYGSHHVWHGHGGDWWVPLFTAACFGFNLALVLR